MKRKLISLGLALAMCLSLTIPTAAAEQKITVNGESYKQVLQALVAQTEDAPVTLRLETDIQLTNNAVIVLGSSDYDGLFGGEIITVIPHDITIDLNGCTLTSNSGYPAFEVESGYTLTIVDSSAEKSGRLISDTGTAVNVREGGIYTPLPAQSDIGTGDSGSDDDAEPVMKNPFTDVDNAAYYAESVSWAVDSGITTGTSATTFSPNNTCTRAQIITFLWRAAGSPKPAGTNPFTDVQSDAYYADATAWAAEQGMADGTAFSPDAPCTRIMAVTFMWKAAGSPVVETQAPFTDVPADQMGAVNWAMVQGITNGTSATLFSTETTCTRAQIVTFLYRAAH
ncbi:MAG: S-layer homology domain-containing protein [Anaerovoracaceae bacterium]